MRKMKWIIKRLMHVRACVQRCFLPVVDSLSGTSATLKIQPGSADLVSETVHKKK